jgi:SAM-dependent methyltransferase
VTTAPDGSPVDLYVLFPPAGEAERVHATIAGGATVLDLGCGVGRIAHELIRLGHPVVAVDESREMLAHVRGAETVQARIEGLDLGRRFPCVLLASHLVNTAHVAQRRAFLEACARHVADDGVVLIERHDPGWTPEEGVRGQMGDVTVALEDVRIEPPCVAAIVRTRRAAGRGGIRSRRVSSTTWRSTRSSGESACGPRASSTSVARGSRRAYTRTHSRCVTSPAL